MNNVLMMELAAVVADTASKLAVMQASSGRPGTTASFSPEQFHACIGEALHRLSKVEVEQPAAKQPTPVSEGGWGIPAPVNQTVLGYDPCEIARNTMSTQVKVPDPVPLNCEPRRLLESCSGTGDDAVNEMVSGESYGHISALPSRSDCVEEAFRTINKTLDLLKLSMEQAQKAR